MKAYIKNTGNIKMKIISKRRNEEILYILLYLGMKNSHLPLSKSSFVFDTLNFNILYKGPNWAKIEDSLDYIFI